MKPTMFKGVQALRGLAALSVMLFHFRWNLNIVNTGLGDRWFSWGATGVDLFFLISGFVITLSAQKSTPGLRGALDFLKHRARRILPAYYIILLITFFLSGAMSIFHYPDKVLNLISALTFQPVYSNNGPFYVDDSGMYGIRWTLNYEVYFYLIVGLLLILPFRGLTRWLYFSVTLIVVPLILVNSFTFSAVGYQTGIPQLNLITNPMIFLFIAGMFLGKAYPVISALNSKVMSLLLLASLAIMGTLFCHGEFINHGIMSSGWLYLIVLTCAIGAEKTIGKYIPHFLIRLGDISFSLYLIHTLMNTGIGKRFHGAGVEDGTARFVLSCVLSLLLAWLSWRFIEKPFLLKGKKEAAVKPLQEL
ncbi:acyltransferase family protein [Duffyella gerundensis]|uniref:acyltransferase family protein n=1 Tax=Duffyella gerundensis TaxID=1619313 RepID=UPI003FD67B41